MYQLHWCRQVNGYHALPLAWPHIDRFSVVTNPRVIDQDVDGPEFSSGLKNRLANGVRIRQIDATSVHLDVKTAARLANLIQPLSIDVDKEKVALVASHLQRDGTSNA